MRPIGGAPIKNRQEGGFFDRMEYMDNKNFNNYIAKVRNNISNIYNAFYLWKSLQKAEYNEIYNRNKYFWGITLSSLQLSWLLGIAKLFEEPRKGQEVISMPFLLRFIPEGEEKEKIKKEIKNQKPILENLWKWRCKILAHQDKVVAENIKDFYKEYPIKGGEIENLLVSIKDILGMIKSATVNHSEVYSFKLIKEESKRDAERVVEQLKYFFQERKKHMEKFRKGEIDNPRFPPHDSQGINKGNQ